jgi:hypothetical protein
MNTIRAAYKSARAARWPLERVLFAVAGTVIVASVILAQVGSPWFSALTLIVGLNQLLYAAVGICPVALVLARAFHLRSAFYGHDEPATQPDPHLPRHASETTIPDKSPGPRRAAPHAG